MCNLLQLTKLQNEYKIFQKFLFFLLISLSLFKLLNAIISSFKAFLDLWSAVLNIKADTTMAELENVASTLRINTALSAIKTKRIALNETAREVKSFLKML